MRLRQLAESCEFEGLCESLLSISRTLFVCCMSGILRIARCIFSCSLCLLDNSLALRASIHLVKSGTGRSLSSLSRAAESREPITNLSRIKVDVIVKINKRKVNKKKQMHSNASSVAPIPLTTAPNVQLLARPALSVANKDTLPLSVKKRIGSQVCQPTR